VGLVSLLIGSGCQLVGYDVIVGPDQTSLDGSTLPFDAGELSLLDARGDGASRTDAEHAADPDGAASESGTPDTGLGSRDAAVDAGAACSGPQNACGGCTVLTATPDKSCGQCLLGRYTCSGPDAVVCTGGDALPVASSSALLIDDFEDGDAYAKAGNGLDGFWYAYSDHTAGTISPPDGSQITPAFMGAAGTTRSAHIVGSGFTGFGAGLILWPNSQHCGFDVSALRGIGFWIKGSTSPVRMSLATPQTLDPKYCGTSTKCKDFYAATFALTSTWTHYTVAWSSLKQGGWGTPVAFVPSQLLYIQFDFGPNLDFELYLDEIGFY